MHILRKGSPFIYIKKNYDAIRCMDVAEEKWERNVLKIKKIKRWYRVGHIWYKLAPIISLLSSEQKFIPVMNLSISILPVILGIINLWWTLRLFFMNLFYTKEVGESIYFLVFINKMFCIVTIKKENILKTYINKIHDCTYNFKNTILNVQLPDHVLRSHCYKRFNRFKTFMKCA